MKKLLEIVEEYPFLAVGVFIMACYTLIEIVAIICLGHTAEF